MNLIKSCTLYIYIDYKQAYDSVDRNKLCKALEVLGSPWR
jgi:hypothetical protein